MGLALAAALMLLAVDRPVSASSAAAGVTIVNRAYVLFKDANGNRLTPVIASAETVLSGAPVLTVSVSESSDPVAMGAQLVYTINYSNTGNLDATNTSLSISLSDYLTYFSASGGGAYTAGAGGGAVTWNIGNLGAGQSGSVTVTAKVKTAGDYAPADPSAIQNGSIITSNVSMACTGASATDTVSTTVGLSPNIEFTLTASSTMVTPGGAITYTIHYKNIGNAEATSIVIRNPIPNGVAYVNGSVTGSGSIANREIRWSLGTIVAGAEGDLSYQVTIPSNAPSGMLIRNIATLVSSQLGTLISNEVLTQVKTPTLTISIESTPVFSGNNVTYTIRVMNAGFTSLSDIVLTDPVPSGFTFVSATGGGALTGGSLVWNIGSLGIGESAVVQAVMNAATPADADTIVVNTVTASVSGTDMTSASVSTKVSRRTVGRIEFLDKTFTYFLNSFLPTDDIHIFVRDFDRNIDAGVQDTVSVTVIDTRSGDTETVLLAETGSDTGIFHGCLASALTIDNCGAVSRRAGRAAAAAPAVLGDGFISISDGDNVTGIYIDPLDPVAFREQHEIGEVSPTSFVFDSVTGQPIQGAVVTLVEVNDATGAESTVSLPFDENPNPGPEGTAADGRFAFAKVPYNSSGTHYKIVVTPPPGYTFPSIVPDERMPSGYRLINNCSRGGRFILTAEDVEAANNNPFHTEDNSVIEHEVVACDIPMDPPQLQLLAVTKTADRSTASIGDIINYTVRVTNNGSLPVNNMNVTDILPHGLSYIRNSSLVDGTAAADPADAPGRTLNWSIVSLDSGEYTEISYSAVVGPDASRGDGRNTAFASGTINATHGAVSNIAYFKVRITEGVFTSNGKIIGNVFLDKDRDGLRDGNEEGVHGAMLYLEDGTRVMTDSGGKFSIMGIAPGTHIVWLKKNSLPRSLRPVETSSRFMGGEFSQFVDIVPGGMNMADFALVELSPAVNMSDETGNTSRDGSMVVAKTPADEAVTGEAATLEQQILSMTPILELLAPADGATISAGHIDVLVKAPYDLDILLSVNEREVSNRRIGRKVTNPPMNVTVYEFVGVNLLPGSVNRLKAETTDAKGNVIDTKEISVTAGGAPARIVIEPDRMEVPADGESTINFQVTVLDANNIPLAYPGMISVTTSLGEFSSGEAGANRHEIKVPYNNGAAEFTIRAPLEKGEAEVAVSFENATEKTKVYFTADMLDTIMIGLLEMKFGYGKSRGDFNYVRRNDWFDRESYLGARSAFFIKQNLGSGFQLTTSYDSRKRKTYDLFNQSDYRFDSEELYPVLGDESDVGYETRSQNKLYLRIDKDRSNLMFGDYQTAIEDTRLSAYNRPFNGFILDTKANGYTFKSFLSDTDQTLVVDTFRGTGVSGFYTLTTTPIIDGSEMVVMETRDRMQPDEVLKKQALARWSDYTIDYYTGRILFKTPVPSNDTNLNPVFIIVSYESSGNGNRYHVYGGRGTLNIGNIATLGVTGITEEKQAGDFSLKGTDLTLRLGPGTTLKTEFAKTRSLFNLGSVYTPVSDKAWSLELNTRVRDNFKLFTYYRRTGDYFGNTYAVDARRGMERHGIETEFKKSVNTTFSSKYFVDKDQLNGMDHRYFSLDVAKTYVNTSLRLGLFRESSSDAFIATTSQSARYPFDNSELTARKAMGARIAYETVLNPKLSLQLEHQQDLQYNRNNISTAGLDYKINGANHIYLKNQYYNFEDRAGNRTMLGVESNLSSKTSVYDEYRLENGSDGSRLQQVIGLKNKYNWGRKFSGDFSLENLNTVSGNEMQNEPDAFVFTTVANYLQKEDRKFTSRLEVRDGTLDASKLVEIGFSQNLGTDYSALLRQRYFYSGLSNGTERTTVSTAFGLAFRPVRHQKFNAFMKMEFRNDRSSPNAGNVTPKARVFSIESLYRPTRKFTLTGKYAAKFTSNFSFNATTDLVSVRFAYDIARKFDIAAEMRLLTSHSIGSRSNGGSYELGYRCIKNVWLSAGYSYDSFDTALAGDEYWGKGPYMRIRFKFDGAGNWFSNQ